MNFVYYTKQFAKELALDGKKDAIERKIQEIAKATNVENLKSIDKYRKGILVLKFQRSNTCRIIIQPETVHILEKPVKVLFVRSFVEKRGFDYYWGTVIHPLLTSGEWITQNPLSQEDYDACIAEYTKLELEKIQLRAQLPHRLTDWLTSFKITLDFQIYERETWVTYSNDRSISGMQDKTINIFRETLRTIVGETTNDDVEFTCINTGASLYTAIDKRHGIGIVYSQLENGDDKKIVILHDGAQIVAQKARWDLSVKIGREEAGSMNFDLEAISKDAFRAYPAWILKDDVHWGAIERHDGSNNLSLLPEQIDFLKNVEFPTYISGQAGSGKSTMLYYLFANIYFYQQGGSLDGDIIFLTENDLLLERTQQSIIGLMTSNPEFQVNHGIERLVEVRNSFRSFRNFLLDFLPEEESIKYDLHKYLDFPRFKKLYLESFQLRRSAEEAWFVLSTYVLGYYEDRNIDTVEKYKDEKAGIPTKFRVIDNEDFREIVNEALPFYSKLISDGYWDKIQLVRAIRTIYGDTLPKQYTVVFCDEAQDFSRIELRLIIQSSEYTKYDLSGAEEIPIVFAGDALQTVNPTGFSEVRLHQMYYEAFKEAGFNYKKENSTYTPQYNYRSVQPIVRLANIVQNYRKESLHEDASLKQTAKRTGSFAQFPILHSKEWLLEPAVRTIYESKFKYKSFIVPVDLDEDSIFVKGEDLLNMAGSSTPFVDIKSSIDAKGAEYSQVVLFGFGDQYMADFGELNWDIVDTNFKRKYFFNKLYVGITRAQNELVIIDSSEAIESFWRNLLNTPANIERWEEYHDFNDIMLISPNTGLDDVQTSTPDEARSNAMHDMEEGIVSRNRARLRVARNVFLMLGEPEMAAVCDGHQNAISQKWREAGEHFAKGKEHELASDAYFQGQCWTELKQHSKLMSGNRVAARVIVSNLLQSGTWSFDEFRDAYAIRKEIGEVLHHVSWYNEFVSSVFKFSKTVESHESKRELAYVLEAITRNLDSELLMVLGQIYFDTKQFTHAIATWDKVLANDENPRFFKSYIIASIEKAIDDKNKHDQLLWNGRLIAIETDGAELQKLSRVILSLSDELMDQMHTYETQPELYTTILRAQVVGAKIEQMPQIAAIVERETRDDTSLSELYVWLIIHSPDDKLAIFMKERWARNRWLSLQSAFGPENDTEILGMLNTEFSAFPFPFSESNFPWTLLELREIPETPTIVQLKPPLHFQNLQVKGFKSFRNFSISNLGLFNLILGGNNSGKTTLLELFLIDADAEKCLLNLLYVARLRENSSRLERLESFLDTIKHRGTDKSSIDLTIINGRRFWTLELRNPNSNEIRIEETQEESLLQYLMIDNKHGEVTISSNSRKRILDLKDYRKVSLIPFIPFGKGYSDGLSSSYYNNVGINRSLRQEFVHQMKLFIPLLVEINIDPDQELIMITEEFEGRERTSPLHEFGEGANKLFRILVQIFVAKDARLMIDEIDAGIHYSIFPKFWSVILQFAKQQNVQLFATTHNEECIRFFEEVLSEEAFEEYRKEARVITLDRHVQTNEIVPIVRDFDSLQFSIDNQYEIRGRK